MVARKYKIVVTHSLGPYKTTTDVNNVKKTLKARVKKMVFSAPKKLQNGYKFNATITYIKSLDVPKDIVVASVKKMAPNAKVSVNIMK